VSLTLLGAGASGSGVFTPLSLSPLLWLDASQIAGKSDGDALATWSDASGNGRDATQSSATLKPLYKTAIFNSKPVVRFDGTDDVMNFAANLFTGGSDFIVLACLSTQRISSGAILSQRGASGTPISAQFEMASNTFTLTERNDASSLVRATCSALPSTSTTYVVSTQRASGAMDCRFNNANTGTGTPPSTPTTVTGAAIGGAANSLGAPFFGDIAELLVYSSLSSTDRHTVEQYLGTKYGVTVP
jgi:hypothetical protein